MKDTDLKIIEKIRKLLAKAKDPASTEAEVEVFMKKAKELMMLHEMEESSIEIHPSDINKEMIVTDLWKAYRFKYSNFEWELLDVIGKAYNCRIFKKDTFDSDSSSFKNQTLTVIGSQKDRIITVDTYHILVEKFLSLVNLRYSEYKSKVKEDMRNKMILMGLTPENIDIKSLERIGDLSTKNVFSGSYLSGCIDGLRNSFAAQKQSTLKEIDSKKHGLMILNLQKIIDSRVPDLIKKVVTKEMKKPIVANQMAYQEGLLDGGMNHVNKLIE